ncbi:unnamed protein product [Paramecium pentaurelia]|uniref:Protein kinase domain-containing protein n=1 Tax=Paramecium pentaurelia TaxID=43138 RepID=A0A8S1X391_9CILI|nr:unnamed protein product [Paramecium pentaurelia]
MIRIIELKSYFYLYKQLFLQDQQYIPLIFKRIYLDYSIIMNCLSYLNKYKENIYILNQLMIDYSNSNLYSTGPQTVDQSKKLQVKTKILGYNPEMNNNHQKFVPLKQILPISIDLLNFILTNLISIILEIIKRDLATPNISIDQIMMIEDNYDCGMPYIFSSQDNTSARTCEKQLLKQFSQLCEQLGYNQDLIKCDSLQRFQEILLLKINFEQDSLKENSKTLFNYFQLENSETCNENQFTLLKITKVPKFILNAQNEDQIAIKITQQNQQIYELREVEIIEDFKNQHLPFLYGYIRYSDILVLFLKKHDWTFDFISLELYKKRRQIEQKQIEQIFLRLYQQMIIAVQYIHSIGIIHRDIKPENIMFDLSQQIQNYIEIINIPINCVMIDFDRSFNQANGNLNNQSHYEGTPFFRPPEGEQSKYNQSYDIWQLGFMWLVIQKCFYQKKQVEFEKLQRMQDKIQKLNHIIKTIEFKLQELDLNYIDEKQRMNEHFKLQNQIQFLMFERSKNYMNLIKEIDEQENFFSYDIELQNIIKEMIHLNPSERANLYQVQEVIDSLIK